MTTFRPTLSAFQAFVLSLAIIAPTLAMAFNVPLAVQAAGRAAPLAFLLGGAAMAMIGLSFVAFSRRFASAGSASTYVGAVLGDRLGFLAGWGLLLAYLAFLASATALVGGFLSVALAHLGVGHPQLWLVLALSGGAVVIGLGGREIRFATMVMLVIEALAVLAIVILALVILVQVPLDAAPLRPDPTSGLSGLGYGMVFAVLSLAGFEGAATVAEETRDPHRAIPLAILGSLAAATLLYGLSPTPRSSATASTEWRTSPAIQRLSTRWPCATSRGATASSSTPPPASARWPARSVRRRPPHASSTRWGPGV